MDATLNKEYDKFWLNDITGKIDHTLLKQTATKKDIISLCEDAEKYKFYSVCVFPNQVRLAKSILKKSSVKVCTVVGFPFGENSVRVKVVEAREAKFDGADEVDMVMTVSNAKRNDFRAIEKEVRAVKRVLSSDMKLKVIIETCLLTEDEIIKSCQYCARGGADYVKTSTGFSTGGATAENIKIMHKALLGTKTLIKASGGIKTMDDVILMINAGASRIGTSCGVEIANSPISKEYILENEWKTEETAASKQISVEVKKDVGFFKRQK
jgi:deoxyribose-phosphate aldolase